jgi:hypothetical protein
VPAMRSGLFGFAVASVAVLSAGAMPGCTCRARPGGADGGGGDFDGQAPRSASASLRAPDASSGSIFSAPIAGAHVGAGAVIVVGLVTAGATITAARLEADGHVAWTKPLLDGVSWAPDVDLKAFPISGGAGGAVVVWRGPHAGRVLRQLVAVGGDGRILDGPITIGAAACATDDGAAWSEAAGQRGSKLRMRTGLSGAPHEEPGPTITEDFTMICGAHRAYAITEGDEGAPPRVLAIPPAAGTPRLTLGPETFGHDDERDLVPYVVGDDLGFVRVSTAGLVQVAEIQNGKASVLRGGKGRLPVDDDIVAVDADEAHVFVVHTHDESERCKDDRGGASVHALRIGRHGEPETSLVLAPGECGKDAGPFWTGSPRGTLTVAWAERTPRVSPTTPPIAGLAYRVLEEAPAGGAPAIGHISAPADALADAGCDGLRCYALALVREPGSDGMSPEAVRLLTYP